MASAHDPFGARFILRARFTSQEPSDGSEPVRYMAAFSGAESWMAWNVTLTSMSRSAPGVAPSRWFSLAFAQLAGVTGGPRVPVVPLPPTACRMGDKKPHMARPKFKKRRRSDVARL